LRDRGGVWFDAGGLDIHLSVEGQRTERADTGRHFGLACATWMLFAHDYTVQACRPMMAPAPWRRFFVHDPFGNRIEIHEPGGLRA